MNGPRGNDQSAMLASELDNHVLLCSDCHLMVDGNPATFPRETLESWKRSHEERVRQLADGGLAANSTRLVRLDARFGSGPGRKLRATDEQAMLACVAAGFAFDPARALELEVDVWSRDADQSYWTDVESSLAAQFDMLIGKHGGVARPEHLSVFASGPIPLLMSLGKLLGDTRPIIVYDRHRETDNWIWPEPGRKALEFRQAMRRPASGSEIALVIELSGKVDWSKIAAAAPQDAGLYSLSISNPHTGCIRSAEELAEFRVAVRIALEQCKQLVGDDGSIHVFAAVPLSAAVAFGQVLLPKASPRVLTYDNAAAVGGWKLALMLVDRQSGTGIK